MDEPWSVSLTMLRSKRQTTQKELFNFFWISDLLLTKNERKAVVTLLLKWSWWEYLCCWWRPPPPPSVSLAPRTSFTGSAGPCWGIYSSCGSALPQWRSPAGFVNKDRPLLLLCRCDFLFLLSICFFGSFKTLCVKIYRSPIHPPPVWNLWLCVMQAAVSSG